VKKIFEITVRGKRSYYPNRKAAEKARGGGKSKINEYVEKAAYEKVVGNLEASNMAIDELRRKCGDAA